MNDIRYLQGYNHTTSEYEDIGFVKYYDNNSCLYYIELYHLHNEKIKFRGILINAFEVGEGKDPLSFLDRSITGTKIFKSYDIDNCVPKYVFFDIHSDADNRIYVIDQDEFNMSDDIDCIQTWMMRFKYSRVNIIGVHTKSLSPLNCNYIFMYDDKEVAIIRMRLDECSIESEEMHRSFQMHSIYEAEQIYEHYLSLSDIEDAKNKSICVFRTGMIYFYIQVSEDGNGYEICIHKDFQKFKIPFTKFIKEEI